MQSFEKDPRMPRVELKEQGRAQGRSAEQESGFPTSKGTMEACNVVQLLQCLLSIHGSIDWVWRYTAVITKLGKQRQEGQKSSCHPWLSSDFWGQPGLKRPYLKKKKIAMEAGLYTVCVDSQHPGN